ncbi:hypothetical protein ACSMXN_12275 [Jatrophihabitans sp. DSM 45814]
MRPLLASPGTPPNGDQRVVDGTTRYRPSTAVALGSGIRDGFDLGWARRDS